MNRTFAIVERELRKFFRSPTLLIMSLILPLVQLIVLGNAFGGHIKGARLGVVDYDHGTQSVKIKEQFSAISANAETFYPIYYNDDQQAKEDVRNGKIQGALIIPAQFSQRVFEKNRPRIALVVDNSDNFMSSTLEQELQSMTDALNAPVIQPRLVSNIALQIVEMYPYIEYMKYLLPGSISLAMFVSVMIGGGMLYIDDKARGVHEGYLVTPITKTELVMGLNLAGTLKAIFAGLAITYIGSLISGIGGAFRPYTFVLLLCMIVATCLAFNAMMFLLMVRVEDPLVPRAMFGILNTLLFFPSGSIYPIQAFPKWLQGIAYVDPFSYAVHGFKAVLLKDAGFTAISSDLLYLSLFGIICLGIATPLFKRTL